MLPTFLHDRPTIASFLRRDPYLNLYALGDLDDFFWPYTTWYASQANGSLDALMLLYSGGGLPILLATANAGEDLERLRVLLEACLPLLPRRFYTHLSPGLEQVLAGPYQLEPHGRYLKMGLSEPIHACEVETANVVPFSTGDAAELMRFYDAAFPGNWFDPRMLETGCYFGIRWGGAIASVAGIHVYSPEYRAAALGNIITHPDYRGRGLAWQVTARLCQELLKTTDFIGLNVRADNTPALAVYTRLGFTPVAEYDEYMVEGC